jgi:hypothetical protein
MKYRDIKKAHKKKLLEAAAKSDKPHRLSHLAHLEDVVFDYGYDGVDVALKFLDLVRVNLEQGKGVAKKNITTKWDGSPSIICGIDPMDGQFFVGTKAALSKEPKVIKKASDLKKYYGDQPELSTKLKYAYKYLSKIGITGIMQGDLMFTKNDLYSENIGGKNYVMFKPNTIAYAVEIDSELGKRILRAKFGIIFHTVYDGTSLQTMSAQHGPIVADTISMLNVDADTWFDDASYKDMTGIASLTPAEDDELRKDMSSIKRLAALIGEAQFDKVVKHSDIAKSIQVFINARVRQGVLVDDTSKFINDYIKFFEQKTLANIEELAGGAESKAAQNRLKKVSDLKEFIVQNINTFTRVLEIYKILIELKMGIIRKLQKIGTVGTFLKTDDGYKVTTPEGFVAVGDDGGVIKLVDRLNFSAVNSAAHGK